MALATVALFSARPGRLPVAVLVGVALVWSTAPLLADLLAGRHGEPETEAPEAPEGPSSEGPTVTTLVRLGDEPLHVASATVGMAVEAGPTVIVVDEDREVPAELAALAPVRRGEHVEAAVAVAVAEVTTDAVLIVSGRAVPNPAACAAAARALGDGVAWVTGRTEPFNPDGFAPDAREEIGAALRGRARRRGLDLWEPDATLVRTEALLDREITHGRPWGSWLRECRADGLRGVATTRVLAFRSAPADAGSFWPDTIARQRAAAADLSRAALEGPARRRLLAVCLLARELYAVPLLAWLVMPVMLGASGEFPFSRSALWSVLCVGGLLALRWASLRAASAVPLRPRRDVLSALHHLPGSLGALPATFTGRLRPLRASIPTRPLVWAALFLTVLAGASLLDREPGAAASKLSVGTSLAALALLWAFTMRSLVQRSWARASARIPLSLAVLVEGVGGTTIDASPAGLSVRGPFPRDRTRTGEHVTVTVALDDGTSLATSATVASRRVRGDHLLLGLALELDDASRRRWLAQVLRGAATTVPAARASGELPTTVEPEAHGWGARTVRAADRAVHLLVATVSLTLVAALVLVVLGFRPLVVRSPSMVPTLDIGDIVLAEQLPASALAPGDIVTQPERAGAESMTHRVVSIHSDGPVLTVRTRGDANQAGETWDVAPGELVGRMRFSVPWIGRLATGVRTSGVQLTVGLLALAAVAVSVLRPRRRRAAPGAEADVVASNA